MVSKTVQVMHYPTLKTVLLVENIVRSAKEPLSRYEIMKRSKNKVMRSTLNIVLQYLEERGMILDSKKGIIWTYTSSKKMKQWLSESVEV